MDADSPTMTHVVSSNCVDLPNDEPPTILNDGLCSRCKELTTYDELYNISQGGLFEHHQLQQIRMNATGNPPCLVCAVVDRCLTLHPVDPLHQVILSNASRWEAERFKDLSKGLSLSTKDRDGLMTWYGHKLYLIANEDDPATLMTTRRPPMTDVASEKVFTLARSWLEICEEKHSECRNKNFKPELPSYVVDVSPDLPGVIARLYKPALGEKAKYLCLSYCWGNEVQLTTTKENRKAHMEAIPFDKLGLTIQDAITTTRRLGFRYLWVDALCIAQNDQAQKASEIKAMASIYKNATVVISAAVASASSEGFLQTRLHDSYSDAKFKVRMPSGDIGILGLVLGEDVATNHPLDLRAWALQEHILSSRKIIFSKAELLVECLAAPNRSPLRPSYLTYINDNWYHNHVPSISTWSRESFDCIKHWGGLVYMYSSRHLTKLDDRLNAFEGIASEIEKRSGKKVRYGIPEFGCDVLGWYTMVSSPARSTRAPCWSWGCLDTVVRGPFYQDSEEYDGRRPHMRFVDDDNPPKLVITACVIDGATWDGLHPSVDGLTPGIDAKKEMFPCYWDLQIGLPDPQKRYYLRLVPSRRDETVLILESAGSGTYRRTGICYGKAFASEWPEECREITLI